MSSRTKPQDRFTADHALDITMSRHEAFEKTMSIIRNMIDSQIRDAAKMGRQSVNIEIPRTVFGRESFDPIEMGRSLAEQLFEDKFNVTGTYTRFIISWGEKKTPRSNKIVKPNAKTNPVISLPVPKKKL
jgi:hypothetical protein